MLQFKHYFLSVRLLEILDGKGGGKGSRFNAKINSFKNLDKIQKTVENLVKE